MEQLVGSVAPHARFQRQGRECLHRGKSCGRSRPRSTTPAATTRTRRTSTVVSSPTASCTSARARTTEPPAGATIPYTVFVGSTFAGGRYNSPFPTIAVEPARSISRTTRRLRRAPGVHAAESVRRLLADHHRRYREVHRHDAVRSADHELDVELRRRRDRDPARTRPQLRPCRHVSRDDDHVRRSTAKPTRRRTTSRSPRSTTCRARSRTSATTA